jgi:hypothetical protein
MTCSELGLSNGAAGEIEGLAAIWHAGCANRGLKARDQVDLRGSAAGRNT